MGRHLTTEVKHYSIIQSLLTEMVFNVSNYGFQCVKFGQTPNDSSKVLEHYTVFTHRHMVFNVSNFGRHLTTVVKYYSIIQSLLTDIWFSMCQIWADALTTEVKYYSIIQSLLTERWFSMCQTLVFNMSNLGRHLTRVVKYYSSKQFLLTDKWFSMCQIMGFKVSNLGRHLFNDSSKVLQHYTVFSNRQMVFNVSNFGRHLTTVVKY
ncbi:unnamed protein product [Mytilus edulis]|uniref:Uncharacterized protein n=1 Tax=Mytilus edulis TaxID=6550 RepID=A0A8S3U8I1_MYTED|nr:unnamed protein product [Mytilus edulis]